MSLVGKTLGQYHIVEFIGAGGMASVYKAYQASLDRYVAVKVLPAQHALTSGFKDRFILEARAVAQLSHPNILPIYDFGLEGDLSYFVMKYVPDRTLSDLVGRPMDLTTASHFIDQAAKALDHAHTRGILHRDVKPANMLLEGDWLLLADFGMAKITEGSSVITSSGHIFGTPAYVSPEQADGKPLDHRTDIYSLGIILYEMVVGRVPYEDPAPMRVIFKHIYETPPAPRKIKRDLPQSVEQVILKALSKNPADRYEHAGDLAEALQQALGSVSVQPVTAPASSPSKRRTRKPAASPRPKKTAASRQPAKTTAQKPVRSEKTNSMKTQPAPPLKTKRPASALGLIWVGGGVLALLMVAVLIFFTNSGNAEGSVTSPTVHPTETQAVISAGPTRTPKATFTPGTSTSVSTPVSPATTTTSNPSTPKSVVSIGGTLAIPVVVGGQFKIYVTGFDGAGLNGPTPVTLDNARQPMFRRDGQALIVNGTSDGVFRGIFVTDAQGGAAQQLNDRGDAYWPVWSPEGDEIMFVDLNRARTLFRQNSQLARSEGDFNPVQANNINIVGNNIVWSDDNRLVFQGCAEWLGQFGECGIWVTNADLIEPIRLTTHGGLPTDAGRGWMTYMLSEDGDWDIYLISLDGGQSVNLTDNNSQDGIAAIAPDGQSVAYISNESGNWAVWTITLSDRQKHKWFDLDPQRGTIDLNSWSEERMSWTP